MQVLCEHCSKSFSLLQGIVCEYCHKVNECYRSAVE